MTRSTIRATVALTVTTESVHYSAGLYVTGQAMPEHTRWRYRLEFEGRVIDWPGTHSHKTERAAMHAGRKAARDWAARIVARANKAGG